MAVTANSNNYISQLDQVLDRNASPGHKWFSLQENVLDGSYHPVDPSQEVGWWGATLSDATGSFPTAQTLTVTFSPANSFHVLQVTGDSLLNEYPVDFTLQLSKNSVVVYTAIVTGNTQVDWRQVLDKVYDADLLTLSITKVNKAQRSAKILESSDLGQFTRTDSITMHSKDTAGHRDELLLKITEQGTIEVTVQSSDASVLLDTESKTMEASFINTDALSINHNGEFDEVTAEFSSIDNLVLTVTDVSKMTNIHTVMDADYRHIQGKVEIAYTDPLVDGDVTITASTITPGTSPQETADTKSTADYKWFSLQENKLDGTYHPIDTNLADASVGWWGTIFSGADGTLPTAEWLKVTCTPRGVYNLKVAGDDKLGEYPVDFDITAIDATGATVLTRQIRGNTLITWTEALATALIDVTELTLTIYKINKPNRTTKIVEFFTTLVETYYGDDLISINLLEEQNFTDMTLPIGNSSANELEVRIYNKDRRFDADNDDSPIYGWLKKNRRIKAWLGAEIVPGLVEWYQLGVFWSQEWTAPEGDVYADVVAYDRLEAIRVTNFSTSQVYVDSNLFDMATTILRDAGLRDEEFVVDDALKNMIIPYMWFGVVSHRDAIVQIAEAALGRVYCDRLGRIVVTTRVITPFVMYNYDYDKSINDLDRPVALGQITNDVEVTAQPRVLQPASEVYLSSDVITLDPNEVYTETINFSDVPVMNVQAPVLTADAGITITSYKAYAWGMEITYTNSNAATAVIQQVTVQGQALQVVGSRTAIVKDDNSIHDNGLQSFTMQNDFIQSYQMAQQIAQAILTTYDTLRHDAHITSRGNIALQLGDRVTVPNKKGKKIEHVITRQNFSWEGSLDCTVDAQLLVGS